MRRLLWGQVTGGDIAVNKTTRRATRSDRLTRKQQRLRREIDDIAAAIVVDHWDILDYEPISRTARLGVMRHKLVRGEVIMKYTLIDEFLTSIICDFYFRRRPARNVNYRSLWRTKKFRIFNHYLMDEIHLLSKLRIVRAIQEVPKPIREIVERINALRNAIAHSFFPENRRQYMTRKKVMYQGFDIFSLAGVEKFEEDCQTAEEYLMHRAYGV